MKFSTRKSLELHIINSYFNKKDVDIFFKAQFVEIIGDAEQLKAEFKRSNDKNNRRKKNQPDQKNLHQKQVVAVKYLILKTLIIGKKKQIMGTRIGLNVLNWK